MILHVYREAHYMAASRRHHIKFKAEKDVNEKVQVRFVRSDGSKASFPAHETVKKTVNVDFMAKNKGK